jgi:hypothetical protein
MMEIQVRKSVQGDGYERSIFASTGEVATEALIAIPAHSQQLQALRKGACSARSVAVHHVPINFPSSPLRGTVLLYSSAEVSLNASIQSLLSRTAVTR